MKKTLIYTEEKSNKFWTIETNANEFTVTYGKVGTAGQTSSKSFDSEEKCNKEAEKLIAEKTKKGYVEQDSAIVVEGKPKSKNDKAIERFLEAAFSKRVNKDPNDYELLRTQYLKDEISFEEFSKRFGEVKTYKDSEAFLKLKNDNYKRLLNLMHTDKEVYFPIFKKFIMAAFDTNISDAFELLRKMALDEEDYGKESRPGKFTPIEFMKLTGLGNFYVAELYFLQDLALACADWLDQSKTPTPLQTFKDVNDAFPNIFSDYVNEKGKSNGLVMVNYAKKAYSAMLLNYLEPSKENEEILFENMMYVFSVHAFAETEQLGEALKKQVVIDALDQAGIKEQVLEVFNKTQNDGRYSSLQKENLEIIGSILVTSQFKNEKARLLYALMTKNIGYDWYDPYKILLKTYWQWKIKGSVKEDDYRPAPERIESIKKYLDIENPDAANSIAELIDFANAKQNRKNEYRRKDKEVKEIFYNKIAAIEKDKALLFDFMSVLADTDSVKEKTLELLKEICSQIKSVEMKTRDYDGKYLTAALPQLELYFLAPEYMSYIEYSDYGPHRLSYMNNHLDNFRCIDAGDFYFGGNVFLDIDSKTIKRLALKNLDCPCFVRRNGCWLVHPTDKNSSGNQKLCFLPKYEEQRFSYETDFNAGTLFIHMLAEAIGIKDYPYKTEIVEIKKEKKEKPKANYTVTNQFTFSLKPNKYTDDIDEVYAVVKNELEEMLANDEKIDGFALATHDVADETCYLQGYSAPDGEIGDELFLEEDFEFSTTKKAWKDYRKQVDEKYHIMAWALMKLQSEGAFDLVVKSYPFHVMLYIHDKGDDLCFVLEQNK